jgi:hypothetical protein
MDERFIPQVQSVKDTAEQKAKVLNAAQLAIWELMSKFALSNFEAQLLNLAVTGVLEDAKESTDELVNKIVKHVDIHLQARRKDKPGMVQEFETAFRENLNAK